MRLSAGNVDPSGVADVFRSRFGDSLSQRSRGQYTLNVSKFSEVRMSISPRKSGECIIKFRPSIPEKGLFTCIGFFVAPLGFLSFIDFENAIMMAFYGIYSALVIPVLLMFIFGVPIQQSKRARALIRKLVINMPEHIQERESSLAESYNGEEDAELSESAYEHTSSETGTVPHISAEMVDFNPPPLASAGVILAELFIVFGIIDFLGLIFDYDYTGVWWSPLAFEAVGAIIWKISTNHISDESAIELIFDNRVHAGIGAFAIATILIGVIFFSPVTYSLDKNLIGEWDNGIETFNFLSNGEIMGNSGFIEWGTHEGELLLVDKEYGTEYGYTFKYAIKNDVLFIASEGAPDDCLAYVNIDVLTDRNEATIDAYIANVEPPSWCITPNV